MQKRAPTLSNILVIVLFALSCFGLLLFLWEAFGGPVPLKPQGYRFTVAFPRTLALANQADVRISGVNVGHVVNLTLDKDGRTHATIEVASRYAPVHSDIHAILRQKTLLGETYVQLIPGSKNAPRLRDGAQLANSQVEQAVTLDDILSAFDPQTRSAFQVWMQNLAVGFNGRGSDINASFATLDPFVNDSNRLVQILTSQKGAVTGLVHNTGVVFSALAGRDHELRGLITNGERTFHAAAQSSQAFADAFRLFPAFERNSQTALRSLDSFSTDASPLLDQLRPFEQQLAPTLQTVKRFSPDFNNLLTGFGPLTRASKRGLPAFSRGLNLLTPVLGQVTPVLHNLDPFLQYAGEYVPELQAFFANVTAASEAHDTNSNNPTGPQQHYLRGTQVLSPDGLSVYAHRTGVDRSNPYFQPGAFNSLASGLPVFNNSACGNPVPSVSGPANATVSQDIINQLTQLQVALDPRYPAGSRRPDNIINTVPAPSCNPQNPFTFNGQTSQYPHVTYTGK
jgi:phospholipid/cholesterol/gamma-HCH transport system substrate-binding protein